MFKDIKSDLPASIVVSLVALPLCLGIALASGAPLFSGIIAGIVGGIVVGVISGSTLGVSGPAAGLAVIVFTAIETLGGSWEGFLVAVIICGIVQLILGYLRAGFIAYFFPNSVIKGMLYGIGVLIILKQIPHALGYDQNPLIDYSFWETGSGDTTVSSISKALSLISPCSSFISVVSLMILVLWESILAKKYKFFKTIPGPLFIVIFGIGVDYFVSVFLPIYAHTPEHLVSIPVINGVSDLLSKISYPDFNFIYNFQTWKIGVVLAIVASIETLLCVEATDKQDPHKRTTPLNRELVAQGVGNLVSGFIGGLPLSQVIVRSSANISFGAKSKLSTILHGIILLLYLVTVAKYINMIPLASLSAILIIVGYKLANPAILKQVYKISWEQFIPFVTTVLGIVLVDLLNGVFMGLACGIIFTLHHSYRNAYHMETTISKENSHESYHLILAEEVSFFNKASIIEALNRVPSGSKLVLDCTRVKSLSHDIVEYISDFKENAKLKHIEFETINFKPDIY